MKFPRFLSLFIACSASFCEGCVSSSQSTNGDLTGIWVLTPESIGVVQSLEGKKQFSPRITLQNDGNFTMSSMPPSILGNSSSGKLLADKGQWNVDNVPGDESWQEISFQSAQGGGYAANIYSSSSPPLIEFSIGEGSAKRFIFFKKQPAKKS